MRVLLTGATGLIGKELGKRLIEQGHVLTVVTRDPKRAKSELPFPADFYGWAGSDTPFPTEALANVDAVFNLAGEPVAGGRWTKERKDRIRDSRVLGTKRLVEAMTNMTITAKDKQNKFILVNASAIGIYGHRGDEVLTETSASSVANPPDFLAQICVDWEREADQYKGHVVKVRTGVVLSRHGGAMEKLIPLFQRGVGGRIGNGQQWMSWIHLDDIVNLFLFALESDQLESGAVLNGTAPEPTRNDRFTVTLARALNRPVFLPVPETALKLAMGEMATVVLASQRVLPEAALAHGFRFQYTELAPALEEICATLKNGQHEFFSEQWINKQPSEIWPYFCSEKNLEELTPKFLNFKVLGKSTAEMGQGTLIDYRLGLHGLPMKWRTRIEEWKPNSEFIDNQLSGPYKRWHHTHSFIPFGGGTLMRDRVLYKLPLGWLGDTTAGWKVTGDVSKIFAFRRQKIEELFGGSGGGSGVGAHE